jgi:hypothetical protein
MSEEVEEELPLCPGCGKPIQRNRFLIDGRAWHFGCAKEKGLSSKAAFYCSECIRFLTHAEIEWCIINGKRTFICPYCQHTVKRFRHKQKWIAAEAESAE